MKASAIESVPKPRLQSRRDFFKILGAGVMAFYLAPQDFAQEAGRAGRRFGHALPDEISAWIHIGEDGAVTVYTGKAEMGQNIRTSLTQAVAEELRAPMSSIKLLMADTDLVPWDAGTFGSQTTPQMASRLHRVAGAAREALLDLAAEQLKTARSSLTVAEGKVFNPADSSQSLTFGQLTKGQKITKTVSDSVEVTSPEKWTVAGTSASKVDGRDFVTGRHKYASDFKQPGMLFARTLRPASFGAKLLSLDTTAAGAIPGAKIVRDGDFVGVVAPDALTAEHGVNALRAEWTPPQEQPDDQTIFDYLKQNVVAGGGPRGRNGGGDEAAPGSGEPAPKADHTLKQTYTVAYIAHTPLEPRAAVADWKEDKVTVWTGTQRPFGVRSELAEALGIPEERVRVIVPDTGSAYGGKHTGEAAVEAARYSRAVGQPVKVVWTRHEEFTWAYFRPAGVIEISSGVNNGGALVSWEMTNYQSGNAGLTSPYRLASGRQKTVFHPTRGPLRIGSYRALASTANNFARESHMDELARLVKMDPLDFRLKNLDNERLRDILQAAAQAFGWRERKPERGRGFGLAGGAEKGSFIATCAEVAANLETGEVKVIRAVSAFDCGAVVNPNHLKSQVEGALMMGLGGALFESIQFKAGRITNAHLADYRVPRFTDLPKIEVVLVDRKDVPSAGAGEIPIVAIAPAINNAIFDACGVRLRSMPMAPDGLKG